MKRKLIYLLAALLLCCSCTGYPKMPYHVTVKKATYEKDALGTGHFTLLVNQKGGFGNLEKNGTTYEKVVLNAIGVQHKTDAGWESLEVLLDSKGTEIIRENGLTEILYYPDRELTFEPKKGEQFRLAVRLRVIYEGWETLAKEQDAPEPDVENFLIEIK